MRGETAATECPRCSCPMALSDAHSHPGNVFLIVPIAGFVMVDVQLLPALWAPGRRRER